MSSATAAAGKCFKPSLYKCSRWFWERATFSYLLHIWFVVCGFFSFEGSLSLSFSWCVSKKCVTCSVGTEKEKVLFKLQQITGGVPIIYYYYRMCVFVCMFVDIPMSRDNPFLECIFVWHWRRRNYWCKALDDTRPNDHYTNCIMKLRNYVSHMVFSHSVISISIDMDSHLIGTILRPLWIWRRFG